MRKEEQTPQNKIVTPPENDFHKELKTEDNNERMEEIKEFLDRFGINPDGFQLIGNWLVSINGDLVCVDENAPEYAIKADQLNQCDWDNHLSGKDWYKENGNRNSFLRALKLAKSLKN